MIAVRVNNGPVLGEAKSMAEVNELGQTLNLIVYGDALIRCNIHPKWDKEIYEVSYEVPAHLESRAAPCVATN